MNGLPRFVLELRDLHRRFGDTEVLRGVSLQLRPGERVGIIGPNGAGKSTLFNLVSGRLAPSRGEILLDGVRIDGRAPHRIRQLGLARSFQTSNLFHRLTAFENLRCALLCARGQGLVFWKRLARLDDTNARAQALLERIGLAQRRDTPVMDLSYAEQRALEIGVSVAGGARVLLLDEPTAGMSRAESARCVALIDELSAGCTLLVVEHDMGVVFALADRIAVLVRGEVIAFDAPAAVRADPRVREAYLGGLTSDGVADHDDARPGR